MKTISSSAVFLAIALHTLGCGSSNAPPEPTSKSAEALGGDCSGALGACYVACQQVLPTPTEGCFTRCDQLFTKCTQPMEEIEQ